MSFGCKQMNWIESKVYKRTESQHTANYTRRKSQLHIVHLIGQKKARHKHT